MMMIHEFHEQYCPSVRAFEEAEVSFHAAFALRSDGEDTVHSRQAVAF